MVNKAMKSEKNTVMGVHAPPPRPNARGFLALALLLSTPIALLMLLFALWPGGG